MGRTYNPCRGCEKRQGGCHAWCPEGIEADKAWQKEKQRLERLKKQDREATGTLIEMKEAVKKGKR